MAFIWKNILFTYISLLICLQVVHTTTTLLAENGEAQQQHSSKYLSHNHNNHNHHHAHTHHQHHNHNNHRRQKSILSHLDELSSLAGRPLRPQNATTRLKALNTRDYYNRVLQRRLNHHHQQRHSQPSERDYNVYNVHTNTFGSPPPSMRPSNGDDNAQDVEFIDVNGSSTSTTTTTKWPGFYFNRRSFGGSSPSTTTAAPPPLVPARRGYSSAGTTTQSPINSEVTTEGGLLGTDDNFDTNVITNRRQPPYKATDMERRHICVQQRVITMPVKTTEIYTRPIMKHVNTPCQPPTTPNQVCTRVQLVHEQAVRDVIRHKSAQSVTYDCCTGWTRENSLSEGCMKPICSSRCQNGGNCMRPDTCSCPAGFTGRYCEQDINECQEEKPCDQTCINTMGSYQCRCREGFTLQADRQSCRKIALREEDAFEARDLENEVDIVPNENVAARLHKIERSLANERVQTHELQRSLQATYNVVDTLKSRLSKLEKHQLDLNRLQSTFYVTENRTNKLEGMLNMLMKCKNAPNANCP